MAHDPLPLDTDPVDEGWRKFRLRAGPALRGTVNVVDRGVAALVIAGRWLVLPIVALLFAQWPLRDLAHAYSREANDLGQWVFALYVAVAVTAATRDQAHLRADGFARGYSREVRRVLRDTGFVTAALPWSALVLVGGWPLVESSVLALERFPDTGNPGYFIVKIAVILLALLMATQGIIDFVRFDPKDEG